MTKNSLSECQIINDVNQALDCNHLHLVYQPQFNLQTNTMVGVEALLRWHHPTQGIILPSDFIPVVENTWLIAPLTQFVLKTACQHMVLWREKGIILPVAINVSMSNLQDKNFLPHLSYLLKIYDILPSLIEIEVTETAVMKNTHHVVSTLKAMEQRGIRIAMDDFGTGQASLQSLCQLPVHTLKIDQFFIQTMMKNSIAKTMVRGILLLGRNLNLTVVAEGIETEEQLYLLKQYKCLVGQGFYLKKPMTHEELILFCKK